MEEVVNGGARRSEMFTLLADLQHRENDPSPTRLSRSLQYLPGVGLAEDFELLPFHARQSLLDDLFEADKCHFHSSHGARLGDPPAQPQNAQRIRALAGRAQGRSELAAGLLELLSAQGLPTDLRPALWQRLLGNSLCVNRALFGALLAQTGQGKTVQPAICRDIDRTLSHFHRISGFDCVLREAELLLQMFAVG